MKRSERHRLKENELSETLRQAAGTFAQYGRGAAVGAVVVVVILAAAGGYWGWRSRTEGRGRALLGEAFTIAQAPVVPAPPANQNADKAPAPPPGSYASARARAEAALPRFMAVANTYPSTEAGLAARYYAAGTLATLGRASEAATRFQEVIDRAGRNSFYGQMAQLGLVDAELQAGRHDQAIAAYQEIVARKDDRMPLDAVLLQLGRAYLAAGKPAEAKKTFDRLLKEFPGSAYSADAKRELDTLSNPG